jgi:hypothetical protein
MDAQRRGQARTIEEVDYDVDVVLFSKDRSGLYGRLLEVLAVLPEEVYDQVIYKVFFTGGGSGVVPLSQMRKLRREYVVILYCSAGKHMIAHELAHVYLGHGKRGTYPYTLDVDMVERQEREAERLAKQWLGAANEDLREDQGKPKGEAAG